jgi:hypothetical protein
MAPIRMTDYRMTADLRLGFSLQACGGHPRVANQARKRARTFLAVSVWPMRGKTFSAQWVCMARSRSVNLLVSKQRVGAFIGTALQQLLSGRQQSFL